MTTTAFGLAKGLTTGHAGSLWSAPEHQSALQNLINPIRTDTVALGITPERIGYSF